MRSECKFIQFAICATAPAGCLCAKTILLEQPERTNTDFCIIASSGMGYGNNIAPIEEKEKIVETK
jgi:hypothetical protein